MEHLRSEMPQSEAVREAEFPVEAEKDEENKETEPVVEKIARAFLQQRYPLSAEGERLRRQVAEAVEGHDDKRLGKLADVLPTVERPHLELFEPLKVTPYQEYDIFCRELINVQTTKGCRHGCSFCAVGAAAKVETMPFAAVLLIAEKKKTYAQEYERQPIGKLAGPSRRPFEPPIAGLHNYYDSDPFDYKDTSFLHEDGSPANYGDVFAALASDAKPIFIATAGWKKGDKTALAAVRRIAEISKANPGCLGSFRVSVNKYEATAEHDLGAYLEDLKAVFLAVSDIKQVRAAYLGDETDPADQEYLEKVVKPLMAFRGESTSEKPVKPSFFSGRAAKKGHETDYDPANCMEGFHIWPDGSIARQVIRRERTVDESGYPYTEEAKGSRPQATGPKLFELRKE